MTPGITDRCRFSCSGRWLGACARRTERGSGRRPVVLGGEVIGEGWNRPIAAHDPTAHAEIVALRAAASRRRTTGSRAATLYVTLEPCAMCVGAALNARVARVVFGAWDQKAGACGSVFDLPREPRLTHRMDVFGGVCAEECARLLRRFFEARR